MSVRAAVERAEQTPAKPNPRQVVEQRIQAQLPTFQAVLPKDFDKQRFLNLVQVAVKANPELMECMGTQAGAASIIVAAIHCATIGLEPNTPLQEAWLLPRRIKGQTEAQLSIGYKGLLKLARRSGEIAEVYAEVVRERDEFHYQLGLHRDLVHVPAPTERGDLQFAYAVVRFKDGSFDFRVLDRAEVQKHRAQSDSWSNERARPYSPWTRWTEAMWRKTALRALLSTAPLTATAARAIESDDRVLTVQGDDITAAPTAPELAPVDDPPPADPDTGEVYEDVPDGEPFELTQEAL